MSEPEFEGYLRQLAISLGLSSSQRQSIAAELRDHLEERLEQLRDEGVSREEACQRALAEFGDAVSLAHDFTIPHHRRQRRQAVRYTLSSVAIVVTTFVMASFYWPVQRPEPFGQTVAQSGAGFIDTPLIATPATTSEDDQQRARLEEKLSQRTLDISFSDTPFSDAIEFIAAALDVDIIIDKRMLEDNGVDLANPITLKIRQGNVSAKTALRLILRQMGMEDTIAVVVRDGFVDLTSVDRSHEVQVYNCRDLLEGVVVRRGLPAAGAIGGMMGGTGAGGAAFQIPPEGIATLLTNASTSQFGGGAAGGMGGGGIGGAGGGQDRSATSDAGAVLIHVIQEATQPASWTERDGDGGTITEFNGLITIAHTQQVHDRVTDLLKKLRAAKAAEQQVQGHRS